MLSPLELDKVEVAGVAAGFDEGSDSAKTQCKGSGVLECCADEFCNLPGCALAKCLYAGDRRDQR